MNSPELNRLITIISTLRGPKGCPWDRAQDFRSMRPYVLEEVYEVLDAIARESQQDIQEELGDLLFVVLLLCQIGVDKNFFSFESLCKGIADKMVTRHPHVFDPEHQKANSPQESLSFWEREKAKKRHRRSRLDGVPSNLPALLRAHRQGEKAAAVGFDWPNYSGALLKVEEEMTELKVAINGGNKKEIVHELGDVLMSLASVGRHLGATPEEALQEANNRFKSRFSTMESIAKKNNIPLSDCNEADLDALWIQAKALERKANS